MPLSLGGSHGENFSLVLIRASENQRANNFSLSSKCGFMEFEARGKRKSVRWACCSRPNTINGVYSLFLCFDIPPLFFFFLKKNVNNFKESRSRSQRNHAGILRHFPSLLSTSYQGAFRSSTLQHSRVLFCADHASNPC